MNQKTIDEKLKEIIDNVYWRGCTDGNEGAGWEEAIDIDGDPVAQIKALVVESLPYKKRHHKAISKKYSPNEQTYAHGWNKCLEAAKEIWK